MQRVADAGRRPSARSPGSAWIWCQDPFRVQGRSDPLDALPRSHVEDPAYHGSLGGLDDPPNMGALVTGHDRLVSISEHSPAGHVTGAGTPQQGLVRSLVGALALDLGGEVGQGEHNFVHRGVEGPLAILEVEPHLHAGVENPLQRPCRLDLLTPEPALLTHDERLERRMRGERIQ